MTPHPWFIATRPHVVMSHHGRDSASAPDGSLRAILDAYELGYRWFRIDVLPVGMGARVASDVAADVDQGRGSTPELISLHAVFGRRRGFTRAPLAEVRRRLGYDVPTLRELLDHPGLRDARWNVEVKSAVALEPLIATLKASPAVSRVMVSAPAHPRIVREVRETFGSLVAVSAPVVHGGSVGRVLLHPRIAYDSMQVHRWFSASAQRRHGQAGLPVQSWTLDDHRHLGRCIRTNCHPVVADSDDDTRRALEVLGAWPELPHDVCRPPGEPQRDRRPAPVPHPKPIEVLLLGGGGWRGAFGSLGAVAYLQVEGRWQHITNVVAISGGSFVAAKLASAGVDDAEPGPALAELAREMTALRSPMRRRTAAMTVWAPLVVFPPALLFAERKMLSRMWRGILGRLYDDAVPRTDGTRRYVVCATGRATARPHFFVAGPPLDAATRPSTFGRIVPPGWTWTDAVLSATALPWVDGYSTPAVPADGDDGRGERLIDGGVVGIFGKQWFDSQLFGSVPAPSGDQGRDQDQDQDHDQQRTLVIDTGRVHRAGGRFTERLVDLSTVWLMSRWVQIGLDGAFRKEIERVTRAEHNTPEGHEPTMFLVRVAETDDGDQHELGAKRDEVLRRLQHGRAIVRRFGLTGLSLRNCLTTVVVAVAACMADIEHEPDERRVAECLERVGELLEVGDELRRIWDAL